MFTAEAERVVVALAAQASIALENARLFEAAQQARAAAEQASQDKDHFLAMLGHELRNPLSAVRNALSASLLDPSQTARALAIASHAAEHLTRLVDDLLDVTRVTQGRLMLRAQPLDLGERGPARRSTPCGRSATSAASPSRSRCPLAAARSSATRSASSRWSATC